jgi:hypothetical protein
MRDAFAEIVLDEPELDPKACLKGFLNSLISPNPYDLVPVEPVLKFDLSKYKFVEEMDVIAGLDSRPDLLALTPGEFEHLTRRLFESMGMQSWKTQDSKDDGVDAVAVNEDTIVGGLCIIQAKRYSKIVGVEAVHALAGVMDDKNAAKGVLVTTSWVGKASRDFAARNGSRIEIIEGPPSQVPAQETPRPRRADQLAQAATRLGPGRHRLTSRHQQGPRASRSPAVNREENLGRGQESPRRKCVVMTCRREYADILRQRAGLL